jgi:hypothetical protein
MSVISQPSRVPITLIHAGASRQFGQPPPGIPHSAPPPKYPSNTERVSQPSTVSSLGSTSANQQPSMYPDSNAHNSSHPAVPLPQSAAAAGSSHRIAFAPQQNSTVVLNSARIADQQTIPSVPATQSGTEYVSHFAAHPSPNIQHPAGVQSPECDGDDEDDEDEGNDGDDDEGESEFENSDDEENAPEVSQNIAVTLAIYQRTYVHQILLESRHPDNTLSRSDTQVANGVEYTTADGFNFPINDPYLTGTFSSRNDPMQIAADTENRATSPQIDPLLCKTQITP